MQNFDFNLANERMLLPEDDIYDYKIFDGIRISKHKVWRNWYALLDEERNKYHILQYIGNPMHVDENLRKYISFYKQTPKEVFEDFVLNQG